MLRAGGNILHHTGSLVVEYRSMQKALYSANMTVEYLGLLYGVSGCDEIPFSRHVQQKTFVESYFSCRHIFGDLFSPNMLRTFTETVVGRTGCTGWRKIERLFGAVWVRSHQKETRRTLLEPEASHEENWANVVRKWTSGLENLIFPPFFLPEPSNIELQVRRAYGLFQYWRISDSSEYIVSTAPTLSPSTGYASDGSPIFEVEEEVTQQEILMTKAIKPVRIKQVAKEAVVVEKGVSSVSFILVIQIVPTEEGKVS